MDVARPMLDGRSITHTWPALSLLFVLVCSSCLSGASGRTVYRQRPVEPTPVATTPGMPKSSPLQSSVPVPPMSLTSPDGTALTLERVDVRGFVDGPLALTELHLDFHNAEARTIEGRFEINLPPGAEISRFAMRVGSRWQEAEVVERQRARVVYETVLHQGLDPALLEQDAGNHFSARVFPIAAQETKQLIVAYTQTLAGGEHAYRIPLRGLPKLASLHVEVGSSQTASTFERLHERYLAEEDLIVPLPPVQEQAFVAQELAIARVVPVPADAVQDQVEPFGSITLLVDTSASRAANFGNKLERLARFCEVLRGQLPGDPKLVLVAFDQVSEEIYRGPLSGLGRQHFERIAQRRPLGATDLPAALARLSKGESHRLLLATDGISTAGETASTETLTEAMASKGFERVDVLVDGSVREQQLLDALVAKGLRFAGQVVELELVEPSAAVARVRRPSLAPVEIEVEGAAWFTPHELRGLQPGDDVLVFARFDQPPRSLHVNTREHEQDRRTRRLLPTAIDRALLERSVVSHQVRELVTELQARAAKDREWAALTIREIVKLSTRHRVLTPYTAMLVLENDAAYERFGLTHDELAPIMTVAPQGVKLVVNRDAWTDPPPSNEVFERDPIERAPIEPDPIDPAIPQVEPQPQPRPRQQGEMKQLERRSAELEEQVRRQEAEERKRLLELERQAAAAGDPPAYEFSDDEIDGDMLAPEGANVVDHEDPDIVGILDPSRTPPSTSRASRSAATVPVDDDMPLESPVDDEHPLASSSRELQQVSHEARSSRRPRPPRWTRPPKPAKQPKPPKPAEVDDRRTRVSKGFAFEDQHATLIDHTVRRCYDRSLVADGEWSGRAEIHVTIDRSGRVTSLRVDGAEGRTEFDTCLHDEGSRWRFRRGNDGWLQRSYVFKAGATNPASWSSLDHDTPSPRARSLDDAPIEGRYAEVLELLAADELERALELAAIWHELFPGDPLALMALGQTLAAAGHLGDAARAYGGIIDLHPSRADILRFAGNLLESLPEPALALALDSYRRAVEARPDQPSGYRMLAMAQARNAEFEAAFDTLERALEQALPGGRYAGVKALLFADLQLIAGAWAAREPNNRAQVLRRVMAIGGGLDEQPSLRFVLSWETDANDVDLHVRDGRGYHAFYRRPNLPDDGGHLVADVTTGFGPEGFIITDPDNYPYALSVDYYNRNSAGHGMGQVQIVAHDGNGRLRFENRPFVVMTEHQEFRLGRVGE